MLKGRSTNIVFSLRWPLLNFRSPLIIFLVLIAPLLVLRLFLLVEQHLPGHDTLGHLLFQYLLFNEAALNGDLPHWFPFMAHGTVHDIGLLTSQSLLMSVLYPIANLFKNVNYLYIFQAALLTDEGALLLGCLLLTQRYFKSAFTSIFVSVSVTYTVISSFQISFDFRILYLLPLTLYCLDRALRNTSAKYFFLTGLFGLVMFLGNGTYLVPFTWFAICTFYTILFCFTPHETTFMLKKLWWHLSWKHLLVLLILIGFTAIIGLYLQKATAGISFLTRTETGAFPVETFLTHGNYTGFSKYSNLFSRYPTHFNFTVYAGLLVVPFVIVSLLQVRSRLSYAFGITTLVLALFGAGTFVSLIFYYLFPLGKYFRYIGLTVQVVKFFLIFYAGFGFEAYWQLLRNTPYVQWQDRPWQDRLTLLTPAVIMTITFTLILIARLKWYSVFDTPTSFWFAQVEMPQYLTWPLLLAGGLLILLVATLRWTRYAAILGSLLLMMHVFDVLSLKVELEFSRTLRVSEAVVNLFNTYDYQFVPERNQNYYANSRSRALASTLLDDVLVEGGKQPSHVGLRYGELYNILDSFLFLDLIASPFRTEFWLNGIDAFHRVWVSPSQRVRLRANFPIPESIVYHKLSGSEFAKLQLFSRIHILPTDEDITRVLADSKFNGDVLLGSGGDAIWSSLNGSTVLKFANEIDFQANDRLTEAKISVEEFTFDTLRVRVDSGFPGPSILYYADAWHPNWHAYVNGEPTPVIRTNLGYKSVIVPPGQSEVLFTFGDWRSMWLFRSIQLLGILAFGSIVYLLVIDLRQSKRIALVADPDTNNLIETTPDNGTVFFRRPAVISLTRYSLKVLKRASVVFGALYFFWQAFTFDWLESVVVWPVVQQITPTPVLIPVGLMIITTLASFSLALLTSPVNDVLFVRGTLIVGLLSDFVILGVYSFDAPIITVWFNLHLVILIVLQFIPIDDVPKTTYLTGIIILLYAWLGTPVIPYTRQYLYEQGTTAYKAGEYHKAINAFHRAIEWTPDSELSAWLAKAYLANGQPDQALTEIGHAVALAPSKPDTYYLIADIYHSLGETEKAIDFYQQTLVINQNHVSAQKALASAYSDQARTLLESGKYTEAIIVFKQANDLDPDNYGTYTWLARAYRANGQPDLALVELGHALALAPDTPNAYHFIANTYLSLGETEQAIDLYQQALVIDPNNVVIRANLAKAYHAQGMDVEALGELQKIIEIAPEHELAKQAQQVLEKYR